MSKEKLLNSEVTIVPERLFGADIKCIHEKWKFTNGSEMLEPVFDLTNCKFMDSSAIGALVMFNSKCHLHGARVILKDPGTSLSLLIKETGLDRVFTIEKAGFVKDPDIDFFDIAVNTKLCIEKECFGTGCLFKMSGFMDFPSGSAYFKQQTLIAMAQYKKIVVDIEKLVLIDSLSIGAILNMNDLLWRTGGEFCLCGANPLVKDMFFTLGINEIVKFFDNRQNALENWN